MGQEMHAAGRRKSSDEPRRIHRGRLLLSRGLVQRRRAEHSSGSEAPFDLDVGAYLTIAFFMLAALAGGYVLFLRRSRWACISADPTEFEGDSGNPDDDGSGNNRRGSVIP
jgi:hypothetical protein